jgi:hypothetical protein
VEKIGGFTLHYPLKPHGLVIQSSGIFPCLRRGGSQGFVIRYMCFVSLFYDFRRDGPVACQSVTDVLMACSHLPLIYWSVGVSFPLTLLQLRTQTKWVVSETSVERCRVRWGLEPGRPLVYLIPSWSVV